MGYGGNSESVQINSGVSKAEVDVINAQLAEKASQIDLDITNNILDSTNNILSFKANTSELVTVNSRIDDIIATPTTVSEQEIIDARQGKSSLGANLTEIKDNTKTSIENKIINGNFANPSLSGYSVFFGEGIVENNTAILTGNGIGSNFYGATLAQNLQNEIPTDDIWYTRARVRSINGSPTALRVGFRGTDGIFDTKITNPILNKWYEVGCYFVPPQELLVGTFKASAFASYPGNENVEKTIEVQKFLAINLTEGFGQGLEPSQAEIEEILSYYSDNWFEGLAQLGVLNKFSIQNILKIKRDIYDLIGATTTEDQIWEVV